MSYQSITVPVINHHAGYDKINGAATIGLFQHGDKKKLVALHLGDTYFSLSALYWEDDNWQVSMGSVGPTIQGEDLSTLSEKGILNFKYFGKEATLSVVDDVEEAKVLSARLCIKELIEIHEDALLELELEEQEESEKDLTRVHRRAFHVLTESYFQHRSGFPADKLPLLVKHAIMHVAGGPEYDERFTRVRADVLSEALEWILAEELEK